MLYKHCGLVAQWLNPRLIILRLRVRILSWALGERKWQKSTKYHNS